MLNSSFAADVYMLCTVKMV